jgi:hypothetical protein
MTITTCVKCRGDQRGAEAPGVANGVTVRTRAWWLSTHDGFGSMQTYQQWLGEAAPVAAARGSGPVRHKAVQRRSIVSWEHAVDSGKGCSAQRQLGALASRRTVELRSTRLW